VRDSQATRNRILDAAFAEFYVNGFQAGSLNRIVEAAGTTKGALFHHFESKDALGYAVLDKLLAPLFLTRWIDPVKFSDDPIPVMQKAFRRYVREDIDSGNWVYGCPLNNLAQEMSPLDEGFHERVNEMYVVWRRFFSMALERGIQAGTVKPSVSPTAAAALIVSAQMGIWGTGKSSRDKEVMRECTQGLCDYLETLRA
jgi:AcrR family transcriptional regulator